MTDNAQKPLVALVSTGGTIAMDGRHVYDWVEYGESGVLHDPATILDTFRPWLPDVSVEPIPFRSIGSTGIRPEDWLDMARVVSDVAARPEITGVVVTHGTATLEESAWFLDLVQQTNKPVVIVGAQRPFNTAGSDAAVNLRAALLTAAAPEARGLGTLVVLNNEIHAARDVAKLSNHALDAFTSIEWGPVGRILADGTVQIQRVPAEQTRPDFSLESISELPRVDIFFSYAGSDGAAINAFRAAGARGIVCAGLPPGRPANGERGILVDAAKQGVAVVLSSRAPRGGVPVQAEFQRDGLMVAGELSPLKARIALMLALTLTDDPQDLQKMILAC